MKKLTAQQVFDTLVNVDQITKLKGQIRFYLGDVIPRWSDIADKYIISR